MTGLFFAIEVGGALLSHSLALLADAGHMFTDVGALILAYAAMTLADRSPSGRYSFGLYRAEILAAFVNAQVLLVISVWILYEAYRRLHNPPEIQTGIMMLVAIAGLVANLITMKLLHHGQGKSLNARAAYIEAMTDMLGSLGVAVTALVIFPTGWYWLDPVVSAGIGLLIVPRTISLLKESAHILLEGTPGHIDPERLREAILALPGVEEVHDLHLWTLTSGMNSASLHLRASPDRPREEIFMAVQELIKERTGVDHATVQIDAGATCQSEGHR